MRIIKTILVGMILAVAIIPLPGHTAATQPNAPQTTAPQSAAPPADVPQTETPAPAPVTNAPPAVAPQPAPTPIADSSSVAVAAPPARSEGKPTTADILVRMEMGRLYHLVEQYPKAADCFAVIVP